MTNLIYRDDDVGYQCSIDVLKRVHEIHQRNDIPHRMAIICRDLLKATDLISWINADPLCEPQYHCYDHIRHTENTRILKDQFSAGVKEFSFAFGRLPTIWYPSWNETNDYCKQVAAEYGMVTSFEKFSLDQHIRKPGAIIKGVINYHYWHEPERHLLEPSMMLAKQYAV